MSIRSMTGFGQARHVGPSATVVVDVRGVNHKGLDLKVQCPSWAPKMSSSVTKLVKTHVFRGRVQVTISVERDAAPDDLASHFDMEAASAHVARLKQLRSTLDVAGEITIDHVLQFKGLYRATEDFDAETLTGVVHGAVAEAIEGFVAERAREGEALGDDLLTRLGRIGASVAVVEAEIPVARDHHHDRLSERVAALCERFEVAEIDESRLAQEIIVYADKSDIAEEVTRANAHVDAVQALIKRHDPATGGLGKKLDFYFQELIRETNTMGSKSQSSVIANAVVTMRSEIERLREQVLNVE